MTDSKKLAEAVNKRRTFAIISHPDAGKTTITEQLLLFGASSAKLGLLKDAAAAILPSLTGWKLKKSVGFPLPVL